MATITPVAFYTGTTIPGTTQIGNLSVGTSAQDYGVIGSNNGITYWATPDQNNGYVIAHQDLTASHTGNTVVGGIETKILGQKVGFWSTKPLRTENAFVQLVNGLFNQSFTGGAQCNTYLNANGMWSSYVDTYHYDSSTFLSWPSSSAGYTLYNGGFNGFDDGYSNSSITLPINFVTNGQSSNQLYLSTNGYFTLGSPDGQIRYSPNGSNPATMAGNPGDNYIQPGLTNNDGDVQNWWYLTGTDGGGKYYAKLLIYCGTCCGGLSTYPKSYVINFYRDQTYQWLESRIKSNSTGSAGPYNSIDVSQGSSTTSTVWRGDLNGQNWVYMGTGTVQP